MTTIQPCIKDIKKLVNEAYKECGNCSRDLLQNVEPKLISRFKMSPAKARTLLKSMEVAIRNDSSINKTHFDFL